MEEDLVKENEDDNLTDDPEAIESTTQNANNPSFYHEIITFISDITSLSETFKIAMNSILEKLSETTRTLIEFNKSKIKPIIIDGKEFGNIDPDNVQEFTTLINKLKTYHKATKLIPRSFIVALISQYDAYLSKLLKIIYIKKPELLNESDKNITLKQLFEYNSIEEAKECILEREIESVMRDSHNEQFKWMERKFNIKLTKDLAVWPNFLELTERRNLYVHNDGVVSNQYLKVCRENKINLSDINLGNELEVSLDYYEEAFNTVFEIGFKLGQVLWRKFASDEINDADENLITIGYNTLFEEKYSLTKMIFDFSLEILKKHGTEENKRMMIINQALAYKWTGNNEKARTIIKNEDWTATMLKFRLAETIILDDYEEAYKIMRVIGNSNEEVSITNYREWPLFKEIKREQNFLKLFEELFEEPYNKILPDDLALSEGINRDTPPLLNETTL